MSDDDLSNQNVIVLATGGLDGNIVFWNATSSKQILTIQSEKGGTINRLKTSRDKSLLVAATTSHIHLYSVNNPSQKCKLTLKGHKNNILDVGFMPVGGKPESVFSCSEDKSVRVWSIDRECVTHKFYMRHAVNSVTYVPHYDSLIAGSDVGELRLFCLNSGRDLWTLPSRANDPIRSISVGPERDYMAVAFESGYVNTYTLPASYKQLSVHQSFQAHNDAVLRCSVAPEGELMATASADCTVRIWNTMGPQVVRVSELVGHSGWVWDCVFSVDAAYLVSASSDMSARLWETQEGVMVMQYKGHKAGLLTCALNDRQQG